MRDRFNRTVDWFIRALGTPTALALATVVVLAWAITGPVFGFSDTWQLVINTATTIITFLMVFVIQNGQNRDAKAVHIKLDELITSIEGARNHVVLADVATEEEQDRERDRLKRLAKKAASKPTPAVMEDLAEASVDAAESTARAEVRRLARAARNAKRPSRKRVASSAN